MIYLMILFLLELFVAAATVIKACNTIPILEEIAEMNSYFTTYQPVCSKCDAPLPVLAGGSARSADSTVIESRCHACKAHASLCVVCHRAVRGIYVWNGGCSHGGHIVCMQRWYATHKYCPAGCARQVL